MPSWPILSALLVMVICRVQSVDYCSRALCSRGKKHIACGSKAKFSSSCPKNVTLLPITEEVKRLLVGEHNRRRNMIAGGQVNGLGPACRMATMQWDDELQALASLNVRQCEMKHDQCRNTERFRHSGQNLFLRKYSPKGNYRYDWKEPVDSWFAESQNTTQSVIDECSGDYKGPTIGHFTVMANERNTRLGCAAAVFNATQQTRLLVACNYGTSNILHTRVYRKCKAAAAKCQTGRNAQFPNLCAPDESYAKVGFMDAFKESMNEALKNLETSMKAMKKSQKKIVKSLKKTIKKSVKDIQEMKNLFKPNSKNVRSGEIRTKNQPSKVVNKNVTSLSPNRAIAPKALPKQSSKVSTKNMAKVNTEGDMGKSASATKNLSLKLINKNFTKSSTKRVVTTTVNTKKTQPTELARNNVNTVKPKSNVTIKQFRKNLTKNSAKSKQ